MEIGKRKIVYETWVRTHQFFRVRTLYCGPALGSPNSKPHWVSAQPTGNLSTQLLFDPKAVLFARYSRSLFWPRSLDGFPLWITAEPSKRWKNKLFKKLLSNVDHLEGKWEKTCCYKNHSTGTKRRRYIKLSSQLSSHKLIRICLVFPLDSVCFSVLLFIFLSHLSICSWGQTTRDGN